MLIQCILLASLSVHQLPLYTLPESNACSSTHPFMPLCCLSLTFPIRNMNDSFDACVSLHCSCNEIFISDACQLLFYLRQESKRVYGSNYCRAVATAPFFSSAKLIAFLTFLRWKISFLIPLHGIITCCSITHLVSSIASSWMDDLSPQKLSLWALPCTTRYVLSWPYTGLGGFNCFPRHVFPVREFRSVLHKYPSFLCRKS